MSTVFNKSLEIGSEGEKKVIALLEEHDCEVSDLRSNHDGCDLKASYEGWPFTLEVKNDVRSLETGNLFLELKAIENCSAEFMCYVSGDKFLFFPTSRLRHLITIEDVKTYSVEQGKVGSKVKYEGKLMRLNQCMSLTLNQILSQFVYGGDIEKVLVGRIKEQTAKDDKPLF